MFTGIIEERGILQEIQRSVNCAKITIQAKKVLEEIQLGDSIAVNGICLTVTSFTKDIFTADVMPETWRRCSISQLSKGQLVNLERAMPMNGRFGGHIVSGHIDGIGKIQGMKREENAVLYEILAEEKILRYVIEKGSIAIDGISLTVTNVTDKSFSVSVIPHTVQNTNLKERKKGEFVNLEADCIGKYVSKFLDVTKKEETITENFLMEHGFL
ncbi:MAG TPA: riboflavin synthase [Candidatus Scybalomonas excrementigallinarum]|nr:riboflavin synthase [Candidatus Scybalomonas excrementigallinarum]